MPDRIRYRRCPNCQVVHQAVDLPRATGPAFVISGQQRRRCPACNHVGPLMAFVFTERPPDQGEGP
jgi:hypothetical protein